MERGGGGGGDTSVNVMIIGIKRSSLLRPGINPFSAGIDYKRQILTCKLFTSFEPQPGILVMVFQVACESFAIIKFIINS